MAHYEIIKEEYIPLATVKKVLKKKNKTELTYEQKLALENAEEFTKLNESATKSIIDNLTKLDMRKLKEELIIKIADLVPESIDELKIILAPSKLSFKDDELEQILEVVNKSSK